MTLKPIGSVWDRDNRNNINENFSYLELKTNQENSRLLRDVLNGDGDAITPSLNGLPRSSADTSDRRNLNLFGVNFTALKSGVIHSISVYTGSSGRKRFGLAYQNWRGHSTGIVEYKDVDLTAGWNTIILNIPFEVGIDYTLYHENLAGTVLLANRTRSLQTGEDVQRSNDIKLNGVANISNASTYTNNQIFDIKTITNVAQAMNILNSELSNTPKFYVGDNPPPDVHFWFRKVN